MKMLSTLLILLAINLPNGVYLEITDEELCSTDNAFLNFNVEAAFKIDRYLAIVGRVKQQPYPEEFTVAIRVMHWHKSHPNEQKKDNYYEAKIWKEIQKINKEKRIEFAFNTMDVKVFEPQKSGELVFIVQDKNLSTAYHFDCHKVRSMSEPTFDANTDTKVVYDPKENWDHSGYLRIKYLFFHFPHELKVLTILIFDRKKLIKHSNGTTSISGTIHHAIVYTEERLGATSYYFRHYLRSNRHDYTGQSGITYSSLDWAFDENQDYCDTLQTPPTAVALLNKEYEMFYLTERPEHKLFVRFIEFYGLKHKVMRIEFLSVSRDGYYLREEQMDIHDNAQTFLSCQKHAINGNPIVYTCDEELCRIDTLMDPFTHFRVEAAFKIDRYLGVVGSLWRERAQQDTATVALRVRHWHEPDSSGEKKYSFYEATLWREIIAINREETIEFAFTTRDVQVFDKQKSVETVFIVQGNKRTTAYQFDYMKVRRMSEPTFNPNTDKKVVYNPNDIWDDSGYLRIKYLFMNVPHQFKVLAILIFDRKKIKLDSSGVTETLHHAIVYTKEQYRGSSFYFRHYMVSVRNHYKDETGSTYPSLDWTFDDKWRFCDTIDGPPSAVALLDNEDEILNQKEKEDHKQLIRFIEFYGLKHRIMRITFPSIFTDDYFVNMETTVDPSTGQRTHEIDNAVAFLNCMTRPTKKDPKQITCNPDYEQPPPTPEEFMFPPKQFEIAIKEFEGNNSFIIITIVVALVMIIVLIILLVVSIVKE